MKTARLFVILFSLLATAIAADAASIRIQAKDEDAYKNTWRPLENNSLELLITISNYNHSEGEIQFRFDDISNWHGFSMNFPVDASHTDSLQDLLILGQVKKVYASVAAAQAADGTPLSSVKTSHITWFTRSDGATEARVSWTSDANINAWGTSVTFPLTISCRDAGAFGRLRARLYKDVPNWFNVDEVATFDIPYDTNTNKIADSWEKSENGWMSGMTGNQDNEGPNTSGNSYTGDGLTVFEEYRGFIVQGDHKSTVLRQRSLYFR